MKSLLIGFVCCIGMSILNGCGTVGALAGGSIQTYHEVYKVESAKPVDVFGKIDAIAAKTGFSISNMDKEKGTASLMRGESVLGEGFIGTSRVGNITIEKIDAKTLKVDISLSGNFGYGSKKNTDELFEELSDILKS